MDKEFLIQGIVESITKCQRPAIKHSWPNDGLSRAQAGVLYLLFYHEKVSSKEVADFLGISKSAATQLLDPLLAGGLVSRQTDANDRRVARLSLTPAGSKALKQLSKHKFAGFRSSLESLDKKELETLYKLHKKMADHISLETKEKNG